MPVSFLAKQTQLTRDVVLGCLTGRTKHPSFETVHKIASALGLEIVISRAGVQLGTRIQQFYRS